MAEPRVHTWVTYALIAANVAMFGVELAAGVHATSPTGDSLIPVGGNYPPLTTAGEWWRLGTAMFLHFGLLHLALNMVCLWQGRVVETLFGRAPFLVLYLLAGIAGGVAGLVRGKLGVEAGASGAVFGVYGAFAAYLWLRKSSMPEAVWRTTVRGIGMFVAINFAFGMFAPNISMTAHVGGLIVGFLVGAAMLYRSSEKPALARAVLVAVVGAGIAIAVCVVTPRVPDDLPLARFLRTETTLWPAWDEISRTIDRELAVPTSNPGTAAAVETQLLEPWRSACKSVATLDPTERQRPFLLAIEEHCAARDASWQALVEGLRATGDTKKGLLERHRFIERGDVAPAASVELKALSAYGW